MSRTFTDPATITPARVRLSLFVLAIGSFGIGTTEFVAMGLLPNIAADLLPDIYAVDPSQANAHAGWMITLYALGVVVGAPTIAAAVARWSRKSVLFWLGVSFTLATVATALLPSFGGVLVARFIAGLPHGAYFGIAALVAAQLMGPARRARGVSLVMLGLTISNIVGVPLGTVVGQQLGWRAAYLLVAVIFAVSTIAIALVVPRFPGNREQTIRRELRVFRRAQVWFALGIGAIGFGGFFAVYSYLTPLATEVAGAAASTVPWLLATMGVGMTAGNLIVGRFADRNLKAALYIAFFSMLGVFIVLYFVASILPLLFLFVFLTGAASSGLGPVVQTRFMDVAGDAQSIAAALNHSAMNIGNAAGAFLGGLVIAGGLGYLAPITVACVLTTLGILIAATGFLVEKRERRLA
ncbi:MFS transporter [Mycetocola spongiae]|uniref:MFS transporter n=1 Tax=Mycetocola spongiae TaxID=2859226 RepID=UPI001CF5748B|nr:MFS transporter [Mycetocola spongiae]UCR90261.1 MFS transporter [Mycetocola spongiae]